MSSQYDNMDHLKNDDDEINDGDKREPPFTIHSIH